MKKVFGNVTVELSGSLVQIKEDGMLLKGDLYTPTEAVSKFEETCKRVESYFAKNDKI